MRWLNVLFARQKSPSDPSLLVHSFILGPYLGPRGNILLALSRNQPGRSVSDQCELRGL